MKQQNHQTEVTTTKKRKAGAKVYFFILSIIFFVLLLDSIVSLGAFGVLQNRVAGFLDYLPHGSKCILFGKYYGDLDGETLIKLSDLGGCGFTLWGQVSIVIVAFVWFVYSLVLICLGPRVFSPMRILDFLMMFLSSLLSFSLSVTLSAGLRATCNAYKNDRPCSIYYLTSIFDSSKKIYFYDPLHSAELSSWIATSMLVVLTIWNLVCTIVYCKKKRKQMRILRYEEIDEEEDSSSPPVEELKGFTESTKSPSFTPFK